MDYDGLKTAIIEMLSGASVEVDISSFQNDIVNFKNKDDIITYLIHLGYLGYDQKYQRVFIPNEELRQELIKTTIKEKGRNNRPLFKLAYMIFTSLNQQQPD